MKIKNGILVYGIVVWIVCMAIFIIGFSNIEMTTTKTEFEIVRELPQVKEIKSKMERRIQYAIENKKFYELTDYERWLVESIVCGESGNQPYWGKVAVASCILNAAIKNDMRPEEVQKEYQYFGFKDIDEFESECMAAYGNTNLSDEVRQSVVQVFDKGELFSDEVLWFCSTSTNSSFHNSVRYITTIGNHNFYGEWT